MVHLRCASLNVQGLFTKRTNKLKSQCLNDILINNDIVMFTETWTDQFSELHVEGFEYFVLHRTLVKTTSKRNSGGIIIYVKNELVCDDTLFFTCQDDIIWVKIAASKLNIDKDVMVGLCYVLPDDSSRQSVVENCIFDRLIDSVINVENICKGNCYYAVFGDYNSRTSTLPDFVANDNGMYMTMLPDDYTDDSEFQRRSQDQGHVNNNGLLLLDLCKQTGLRILNGRVGQDSLLGKYTFVNSRGCSVIDYVSQKCFI